MPPEHPSRAMAGRAARRCPQRWARPCVTLYLQSAEGICCFTLDRVSAARQCAEGHALLCRRPRASGTRRELCWLMSGMSCEAQSGAQFDLRWSLPSSTRPWPPLLWSTTLQRCAGAVHMAASPIRSIMPLSCYGACLIALQCVAGSMQSLPVHD